MTSSSFSTTKVVKLLQEHVMSVGLVCVAVNLSGLYLLSLVFEDKHRTCPVERGGIKRLRAKLSSVYGYSQSNWQALTANVEFFAILIIAEDIGFTSFMPGDFSLHQRIPKSSFGTSVSHLVFLRAWSTSTVAHHLI